MSPSDARDIMLAVFSQAWTDAEQDLSRVLWDDRGGTVPAGQAAWARVTIKHDNGHARAFGASRALYSNTGTLWIQVFTPEGNANEQAYDLSYALVQAYRNALNAGVTYRNPRLKEVGVSGAFEQTNVLTDFSYDD